MASRGAKQILRQQLEEEYETESKVIALLNQFGGVIIKKYEPLKFSIDDIHVLFKYANERLRYLSHYCELNNMENSLKHLACMVFKALFLDLDDFKLDDLEKKIKIFRVIIDCIKGIPNENQAYYLNELMNYSLNKNLILLLNQLFKGEFFIFLTFVILKYQPNLFNEFIIRKFLTYSNIKIDFEYSELENFTVENLIDDLFNIFGNDSRDNKTSLIHLKIENEHLKTEDFSNEEIIEVLEDSDGDKIKSVKKSIDVQKSQIKNSIEEKALSKEPKNIVQSQQINPKENKGKKNVIQSQQIESKSTNENSCIIQSPRINQNEINENKSVTQFHQINPIDINKNEIQSQEINQKEIVEQRYEMLTKSIKEKKNDIKGQEIKPQEINLNSENEENNIETKEDMNIDMKKMAKALADLQIFKKETEIKDTEIQNYIKQNKQNIDKIENLEKETKYLREELTKQKKSSDKKNKALKKENELLKKAMNSMDLDMTNTRNELDKVKSDLELIKLRDGLKNFYRLCLFWVETHKKDEL